ncbi:MAG TPA: hypothetical protein VFY48_04885 [Solirubrobacterales bacterium]|nr:hypothetical protein [Solirubrobacterales bacterium]
MPRLISIRLAAACALALILTAGAAIAATGTTTKGGKGVPVELRVVGKGGKVLTEEDLRTGTISIKTSPRANCFGPGSGGSGAKVKVKGATALGALAQAAKTNPSLQPLLITDAFDFGLGICGVGSSKVSGKASWYLKVNHKGATVGGDAVKLRAGDEVLWDLAPSFPYPNELDLEAPERVETGVPFTVRVFSYDEKGKRKPVAGAKVSGAAAPVTTAADGSATVTLVATSPQYAILTATHGKEIPAPAAPVYVCVAGSCPAAK